MPNSWDQLKKGQEDSYFDKKNRELLKRLKEKKNKVPTEQEDALDQTETERRTIAQ